MYFKTTRNGGTSPLYVMGTTFVIKIWNLNKALLLKQNMNFFYWTAFVITKPIIYMVITYSYIDSGENIKYVVI